MAIIKCKMCGGALEVNNETVAVCEYCGTKQTLPKLSDDCKANLYDRANHFRRNNEYDKAMGIYERILNDDNTDAESYWSLVLCRYGIEYVEDPASHKRVPTVNRAQFTSVFDDEDYKSSLRYADGYQREIYEQEAAVINEIQKGILAISSQEEPFDVFVCYKETDSNGRRTTDSVLATELYHELTREGYKVFFSRITLEDKLGSAYEPYIFSAINSAKVMVVLGTKPEHFNAIWVKNEWSRYLALIKNGARKMLIPAYKDMDPYDLPEEFSHLQAQDMSKLGFMQDLIRGVKKILDRNSEKKTIHETIVANETMGSNVTALLKRGFMALEDSEWKKADDFFEQALNQNAELAEAYLGKLMAELQVRNQDSLKDCVNPFEDRKNYQKAVRFANAKLRTFLVDTIRYINERNAENARADLYKKACNLMSLRNASGYSEAITWFKKIPGYRDADELAQKCAEQGEAIRKDGIYHSAITEAGKNTIASLESAIVKLDSISDWKDTSHKQQEYSVRLSDLRTAEERRKLEAKQATEKAAIEQEQRKRKTIKAIKIVVPICALIVALVVLFVTVALPEIKYQNAVQLMEDGHYKSAVDAFLELGEYKEAEALVQESIYLMATDMLNKGQHEDAIHYFDIIDDHNYKDSSELLRKCNYLKAKDFLIEGSYQKAIEAFETLGNYDDSPLLLTDAKYKLALEHLSNGYDKEALEIFLDIRNYSDVEVYLSQFDFILAKEVHEGYYTATYNDKGLLIETVYDSGLIFQYSYDERDKKVKEIFTYPKKSARTTTVYTYDAAGNLTMAKETGDFSDEETLLNQNEYKHNNSGQVIWEKRYTEKTDRDYALYYTYEYDQSGNLIARYSLWCDDYTWMGQLSGITIYSYDENGNCISEISYESGSLVMTENFEKLPYLSDSEKKAIYGSYTEDHKYTRTYNADNQIVKELYRGGNDSGTRTYYYENGLLVKEVHSDSFTVGDVIITYSYDTFGNLVEKMSNSGSKTTYTYSPVFTGKRPV